MNPRQDKYRGRERPGMHRQRYGFTLIELLTVLGIIGVLSSMVLLALYSVSENARKQRTKAQITKIHELISGRWESYRTRPMPISAQSLRGKSPRYAALLRLKAMYELMRLEMPDRQADLLGVPEQKNQIFFVQNPDSTYVWSSRGKGNSSLFLAHKSRLDKRWSGNFQSAECLYMILASIQDGDTNGLDFFREREKGDVDNDGMPEILDGWGQPIAFLRWAPAYIGPSFSTLQFGDLNQSKDGDAGEGNGDPFDPLKVNPRWRNNNPKDDPFALFPLIYSIGPDGDGGVDNLVKRSVFWNPYETAGGTHSNISTPSEAVDNISNHMLEAR